MNDEMISGGLADDESEGVQYPEGTITKVERQPRAAKRYNIYIDDQYAFAVHEDVLIKHRLVKGEAVDAEQVKAIVEAEERQKAYLDAIRLLSSRLRSELEIEKRLKQKEYSKDVIEVTVLRLRQEGYLDDALFAEQVTKQRVESQKKGRHWIRQELKQKGISKGQIQEALSAVDEDTEYTMAYSLAIKRYPGEAAKDPQKARRKIGAFLQRRGYPGSVVSRVLQSLPKSEGHAEDWDEEAELSDFD